MCVKHNPQPVTTAKMVLDQRQNLIRPIQVSHVVVKPFLLLLLLQYLTCKKGRFPQKSCLFLSGEIIGGGGQNFISLLPPGVHNISSSSTHISTTIESKPCPFYQESTAVVLCSQISTKKKLLQRRSDENNSTTNTNICSGDSGSVLFKFVEVFFTSVL